MPDHQIVVDTRYAATLAQFTYCFITSLVTALFIKTRATAAIYLIIELSLNLIQTHLAMSQMYKDMIIPSASFQLYTFYFFAFVIQWFLIRMIQLTIEERELLVEAIKEHQVKEE